MRTQLNGASPRDRGVGELLDDPMVDRLGFEMAVHDPFVDRVGRPA